MREEQGQTGKALPFKTPTGGLLPVEADLGAPDEELDIVVLEDSEVLLTGHGTLDKPLVGVVT